jgi:anthranilate 3-monooxygenase (FAD) / 4-hydroxyphenylacetate 3-monooxygenase
LPARSGLQYIDSLRTGQPCVYLNGGRVQDVTSEPLFAGPLQAVAEQYDMQRLPAYQDVMTYASPATGDRVSRSFMIPRSRDDLVLLRQHFKLRTDHNFGFMGRAPDFMNAFVTGLHLVRDRFGTAGDQFAENATRYYEHVRENDLFLTHMLINPQIDRSKTSAQQEDPFLHLGKVGETREGIVVRGAKMLATMAPLTEEVLVLPFGGVAPGDDAYALVFAIPNTTPGLKYICRETVAPLPRSRFDHPLGSRFEEMDCIAIFEDVLVPWERVFVDGRPGSREIVNSLGLERSALTGVQVEARMLSQMEFFCGLAMRLADAIGITEFLHVQEKLGEMLTHLEVARAVYYGSEAMACERENGVWLPPALGLRAFHFQTPKIYSRFVEIVQTLAGGGFFYAPADADFQNPEIRPAIDKYARGRAGISAAERTALFKLAWDVTGEAFGQRLQQYVRFYTGDPIRLTAGFYAAYDKQPLLEIVDRALGKSDATDIPISPRDPGAAVPVRPPPGVMSGAYPASSHPKTAQ